jgi:hypothetical protein
MITSEKSIPHAGATISDLRHLTHFGRIEERTHIHNPGASNDPAWHPDYFLHALLMRT